MQHSDSDEESYQFVVQFGNHLGVPTTEEARKIITNESKCLLKLAVTHPITMTTHIFNSAKKMHDSLHKLSNRISAQKKLSSSSGNGQYIATSLRSKNPISIPNDLQDNETVEKLQKESNQLHDEYKQHQASIAKKMNDEGVVTAKKKLQTTILNEIMTLTQQLIIACKNQDTGVDIVNKG